MLALNSLAFALSFVLVYGVEQDLLKMFMVDLSYGFDKSTIGRITEKPFEMTPKRSSGYFVSTVSNQRKYPEKSFVNITTEEYGSGTHVGTHIDAPCHVVEGRWNLDQIPLNYFVANASVVDITHRVERDRNALLLVEDLQKWEEETGETLDDTILLVRTGWGRRWPDRKAYEGNSIDSTEILHFPGISANAARWIVENRKIYGVGIESSSLDSGLHAAQRRIPAHEILLGENIYGIENVSNNLRCLPPSGALLIVAPLKLEHACGAPARLIALFPSFKDNYGGDVKSVPSGHGGSSREPPLKI